MIALFNPAVKQAEYYQLDLSVQNEELNSFDIFDPSGMQSYIEKKLRANDKTFAIGGYLERRNIYKKSGHFDGEQEDRNIHLGIDLWADKGEVVYCPWEGKVHSFQNNSKNGDYGPTIILEHQEKAARFYTLYGHLSLDSLKDKEVGQTIKAGTVFCSIGDAAVNGGYAPHLHFQIVKDLEGKKGDYPGVCSQSDFEFYQNNCPNPLSYLNFSS
jgi:murein DD-endopeptidase MepM/ murein hydrolase activator NlpD